MISFGSATVKEIVILAVVSAIVKTSASAIKRTN
jgi:hypothetical protein